MTKKNHPKKRRNLELARVRAVKAYGSGAKVVDIAHVLGIHPVSVSRWLRLYREGGAISLRSKIIPGRPRKYDCKKIFPGIRKLVKKDATDFGFDTPLWTSRRLQMAMSDHLKLKISGRTVRRVLAEIGLSYQKPEKRAYEQDKKSREIWINKTWPELKERARRERAVVLFGDECSVSLNPTNGKTWAPIGRTPVIRVSASRGSVPVISAITQAGRLYFSVQNGNINANSFIGFLRKLLAQIPRKRVYLVVDNCSAHRAKKTSEFVGRNPRLTLTFLPPYSPDFNPDELVWAHLKAHDLAGHGAKDKSELRGKTRSKMRRLQKKRSVLKNIVKSKT